MESKDEYIKENSSESLLQRESMPYLETINQLRNLTWMQSPVEKIDLVYRALKFKLAEEVDNFWDGSNRFLSKNERNIDMDNL